MRPEARPVGRDVARQHIPGSEANHKENTIRNVCRKCGVPDFTLGIRLSLVNRRMFMNSCIWASVHLSKDGDQIQRVLRDMDVESIQKLFTTVQKQVRSLQNKELLGLQDQLDWTESSWMSCSLLDQGIN